MSRYVIICGGRLHPLLTTQQRDWLDWLHTAEPFIEVIVGSVEGADAEGQAWARTRGINCVTFWPNWTAHGRSGGPRRNTRMLKYLFQQAPVGREHGVLVVAFPGGRGTADMCRQARQAGVVVRTWDNARASMREVSL